jgi:hypothetical protein
MINFPVFLNHFSTIYFHRFFQAEKKLKSVRQSEMNRVSSEDAVRFAQMISKSHSVASSPFWQPGDPQRPFPTEADFARSSLVLNRVGQCLQNKLFKK